MRPSEWVICPNFPCLDVQHGCYCVPGIDLDVKNVKLILISEATPPEPGDYYYAPGNPLFAQNTVHAFQQAGVQGSRLKEILDLGVYLTTAIKCAKTSYGIQTSTIQQCAFLLEKELVLFPNVQAYLLMGDVAIKALNTIAKRRGWPRVIPAGATYKIRGGIYTFEGKRAFPSYLQVGPSYGIEKSKQKMIAEDIAAALQMIQ